jgi:hypothetical protein
MVAEDARLHFLMPALLGEIKALELANLNLAAGTVATPDNDLRVQAVPLQSCWARRRRGPRRLHEADTATIFFIMDRYHYQGNTLRFSRYQIH